MVRRRRRLGKVLLVLVVLLVALGVVGRLYFRPYLADYLQEHRAELNAGESIATKQAVPFAVGERTLIIAPHPDDETLGGAGVIEKALATGKQVKVVIMTSGDGYKDAVVKNYNLKTPLPTDFRRLGEARHLESLHAMQNLGVPAKDVLFLGYPDGGVNGMWEQNWDYDRLHLGLNGAVRSPYSFAFETAAPYCGANVVKNLTAILKSFQPTDVVYPDPNDQHHDHWATQAFVKYVLTVEHYRAREWTYLVHRGDFPMPWMYRPNLPLDPPYVLAHLDTRWVYPPMSSQEEQIKWTSVKKYTTQIKTMPSFLEAFVRKNELLGTYTDPQLPVRSQPLEYHDPETTSHYLMFPDPYADTLQREMEASADVTAVGAVKAGQTLNVGLETKAPIQAQVEYSLRLRFIAANGVQRLDLRVKNQKPVGLIMAQNSLDLPPQTAVHQDGNRLWVSLPQALLNGVNDLMISADTVMDAKRIDRTSWRLLHVKKTP